MATTKRATTSKETAFLIADFPVALRLKLRAKAKRTDSTLREVVIAALRKAV